MSSEDQATLDLQQVEAAIRPLRRLLGRQAIERSPSPQVFQRNLARLARPLRGLSLAAPLQVEVDAVVASLEGDGIDPAVAWQAIVRLDERLGLPVVLKPAKKGVWIDPVEPPADAPPKEGRGRRRKRRGRKKSSASEDGPGQASSAKAPGDKGKSKRKPKKDAPSSKPEPRPKPRSWEHRLTELVEEPEALRAIEAVGWRDVADALLTAPEVVGRYQPIHGAGRELPQGDVAIGGRARLAWTRCAPDGTRASSLKIAGAGPQVIAWREDTLPWMGKPVHGERLAVGGTVGPDAQVSGGHLLVAQKGEARALRRAADPAVDEALSSVQADLLRFAPRLEDPLPKPTREAAGLVTLSDAADRLAVSGLDDPKARSRILFDKVLSLQLGRSWARFQPGKGDRGIPHAISHSALIELEKDGVLSLPTPQVAEALEHTKRQLRLPLPMRRLVWGTAREALDDLAIRTILLVAASRAEVLVVGPDLPSTQILHDRFAPQVQAAGFATALLDGAAQGPEAERLKAGEIAVVFAPWAALQTALPFRRLGLVVGWEQTVLGQVEALVRQVRQPSPDVLTVVRGPLPAPMLWRVWPMTDVARLGAGAAAAPRATRWKEGDRAEAYRALAQDVGEGFSGVVAFPMRRGGADLMGQRELEAFAEQLSQQVFGASTSLAVIHGAMSSRERLAIWERLMRGALSAVVSTVPVELLPRPAVPTSVLVEHADRMDLARVLSLRALAGAEGRVHLVAGQTSDGEPDRALAAMEDRQPDRAVLEAYPSSMRASEVVTPGEGELPIQEGDLDLLLRAREVAHDLMRSDPGWSQPGAGRLLRWAHRHWQREMGDAPCPLPSPKASAGAGRRRRRRRRGGKGS